MLKNGLRPTLFEIMRSDLNQESDHLTVSFQGDWIGTAEGRISDMYAFYRLIVAITSNNVERERKNWNLCPHRSLRKRSRFNVGTRMFEGNRKSRSTNPQMEKNTVWVLTFY